MQKVNIIPLAAVHCLEAADDDAGSIWAIDGYPVDIVKPGV